MQKFDSYNAGVRHFESLMQSRGLKLDLPGCVVGSGDGNEVHYLAQRWRRAVIGFDIEIEPGLQRYLMVAQADAGCLPLPNDSHSFVFSHHMLEHVKNPAIVLAETYRILAPGGWLYLGTPNRTRILGYLGSRTARPQDKVLWNIKDYKDRLLGRFENSMGAHAGFSRRQLVELAQARFSHVEVLSENYQIYKYEEKLPDGCLAFLLTPKWVDRIMPSHYLLCIK